MNNIVNFLFKLIKSAIDDAVVVGDISFSEKQEKQLYALASAHDMAHLVSYALDKNDIRIKTPEIAEKFKKQQMLAIFRYERQNHDMQQLETLFSELKIRYIPLKGSVLRSMYPVPWMRTSCDIDILIDESNMLTVRDILNDKLGYSFVTTGNHDLSFETSGGVHFELHFCLLDNRNEDKYLKRVWKYAHPKETGSYEYVMSDEIFYYYHVYHASKHFINGGCGIKPFLDLWMLNKNGLSLKTIDTLMIKSGKLYKFAQNAEYLSQVWFENAEETELSHRMQGYILNGGTYGNALNKQIVKKQMGKRDIHYIISRIWLSLSAMQLRYPKLRERRLLLPLYQVKRWFDILFSTRSSKNSQSYELDPNIKAEKAARCLIKSLGL